MFWDGGGGAVNSYVEDGDTPTSVWTGADPGYGTSTAVHALAEMAGWANTGAATSQIYDTKLSAPGFSTLSWTTNGSGTYSFKVRSSSDSQMSGAPAWNTLLSYANSPANVAVDNLRYVQWQATLSAASPYMTYPQLDNVLLKWPGGTSIVDISGYYTKRPNYGMFKVQVDGQALVNALQVDLSATKIFQGKSYSSSLSAEVKARNTGK